MRRIISSLSEFFKKADMLLLLLCVLTSIYGIVVIASATAYNNDTRYVTIQAAGLVIGVAVYILFTLLDVDIIAERRELLLLFSMLFILMLKPFGVSDNTGNKSWLLVPVIGISVQPGEICKVFYILIVAKLMSVNQNKISSLFTILKLLVVTVAIAGLMMFISSDWGVALNYVGILVVMMLTGGVSAFWFLLGAGGIALLSPIVWSMMGEVRQNRILAIYDSSIDPDGLNQLWQTNLGKSALTGGGLTGQGLFNGSLTQSGSIPAQHTDYIFTVIGEELGLIGCLAALALLFAIIARCIWVGIKSRNYMNRQICFGIAGMLLFQIFINVGMCVGILPVIGLTLPFMSYGGSSIVTMFMAVGIVSGIHMRPAPDNNARYVTLSPLEGLS